MKLLGMLYALIAGYSTAIEQTINGRLGEEVTPGIATLHNLITGAVAMLLLNLIGGNLHHYADIRNVSPAYLFGGIFGAMIIYFSSKAVPVLGVTTTLALVIAGELSCGLLADFFLTHSDVSPAKWAGVGLVLVGSLLMTK